MAESVRLTVTSSSLSKMAPPKGTQKASKQSKGKASQTTKPQQYPTQVPKACGVETSPVVSALSQHFALLMDDDHVAVGGPAEFATYTFPARAPVNAANAINAVNELEEYPFPKMPPYDGGQVWPDASDDPFISSEVLLDETLLPSAPLGRRKSLYITTSATVLYNSTSTPPLTPAGPSPCARSVYLPTPTNSDYSRCDGSPAHFFDSPEQHIYRSSGPRKQPDPVDECQPLQKECHDNSAVTMTEKMLTGYTLPVEFISQYVIESELGTGGFGFVVRARRVRDAQPVAVKFIIKENMPSIMWRTDPRWCRGLSPLPSEAVFLMNIYHDGIIGFIDLLEDRKFFYLVMEFHGSPWTDKVKAKKTPPKPATSSPPYMVQVSSSPTRKAAAESPSKLQLSVQPPPFVRRSSCDLFECIESRSRLTEGEARYVFAQILCAVRHLHRQGIYHMDMKDENIVIDEQLKVKLIDFGSAVQAAPTEIFKRFFGTIAYASPEVLKRQPYLPGPNEVWALGVIYSILLVGESLYKEPADVLENRYNHKLFQQIGPHSQQILCLCLEQDPNQRIPIEQLCAMPWLREAVDEIERRNNAVLNSRSYGMTSHHMR